MVVSRSDDVQYTCGRFGARDPQVAAGGEECRGTPASEAKSSEGKGGIKPGELAIGFPQPPFPRPAPQATSETLPYCILRRMSTDEHRAASLANLQLPCCGKAVGGVCLLCPAIRTSRSLARMRDDWKGAEQIPRDGARKGRCPFFFVRIEVSRRFRRHRVE